MNEKILVPLSDMGARGINWLFIVTLPVYTPPEIYGAIILFYSLEILLSNLCISGQDKYTLRFFDECGSIKLSIYIILISSVLLSFLMEDVLFYIIGLKADLSLLISIYVVVVLNLFNRLYLSKYRIQDRYIDFSKQRILVSFTKVIGFYIFYKNGFGYESYIYGSLSSLSVSVLFMHREICMDLSCKAVGDNSNKIKRRLLFGAPVALHLFGTSIISHGDKFLINYYLDAVNVGVYSFSYMLGSGFTFCLAALSIHYEPKVYKNPKIRENIINKFFYSSVLLGFFYLMILLLILHFEYLFGFKTELIYYVVIISFISHFSNVIYLKSSYRQYSRGKSGSVSIVTIASSSLNLIFNVLLIPLFGLKGAIFSTMVSSSFLAVFMSYSSMGKLRFIYKDILIVMCLWALSFLTIGLI